MKKCAIINECPFFNDQLPKSLTAKERDELKTKFCGGGSEHCARFLVAEVLGTDKVPANLCPDDFYKVSVILEIP